mmetsp:Transcript_15136/g.44776  ORF Transcript_15136/g.44776 Transcript_15136/m.44776 type:complete len:300 (-) Transcript_15136:924-1823(-)
MMWRSRRRWPARLGRRWSWCLSQVPVAACLLAWTMPLGHLPRPQCWSAPHGSMGPRAAASGSSLTTLEGMAFRWLGSCPSASRSPLRLRGCPSPAGWSRAVRLRLASSPLLLLLRRKTRRVRGHSLRGRGCAILPQGSLRLLGQEGRRRSCCHWTLLAARQGMRGERGRRKPPLRRRRRGQAGTTTPQPLAIKIRVGARGATSSSVPALSTRPTNPLRTATQIAALARRGTFSVSWMGTAGCWRPSSWLTTCWTRSQRSSGSLTVQKRTRRRMRQRQCKWLSSAPFRALNPLSARSWTR